MIGRSLDACGEIPAAKLAEVLAAVVAQHRTALALGASHVRCLATAGVRRARNGAALAAMVRRACDGLEVEILSGEQEARLAFIGAVHRLEAGAAVGVVDVGGGSCELVLGEAPDRVRWWASLPLGSSDVTERWLRDDPPGVDALARAAGLLARELEGCAPPGSVERVLAVGGSATSLRALAGPRLEPARIESLLARAAASASPELARALGIERERARLLAGGLLILRAVQALFGAALELGEGGVREGALLDHQ